MIVVKSKCENCIHSKVCKNRGITESIIEKILKATSDNDGVEVVFDTFCIDYIDKEPNRIRIM